MLSPELSDVLGRVLRLESQSKKQPSTQQVQSIQASAGETVFFNAEVSLVTGNPSGDVSWTDTGASNYVPEDAKMVVVRCGSTDTSSGTGLVELSFRSGDKTMTAVCQRGSATGDTQNVVGQFFLPYSGGLEYSIDMDGNSSFPFFVSLQGYVL